MCSRVQINSVRCRRHKYIYLAPFGRAGAADIGPRLGFSVTHAPTGQHHEDASDLRTADLECLAKDILGKLRDTPSPQRRRVRQSRCRQGAGGGERAGLSFVRDCLPVSRAPSRWCQRGFALIAVPLLGTRHGTCWLFLPVCAKRLRLSTIELFRR
jgi:hypothetical protein